MTSSPRRTVLEPIEHTASFCGDYMSVCDHYISKENLPSLITEAGLDTSPVLPSPLSSHVVSNQLVSTSPIFTLVAEHHLNKASSSFCIPFPNWSL